MNELRLSRYRPFSPLGRIRERVARVAPSLFVSPGALIEEPTSVEAPRSTSARSVWCG